MSDRATMRFGRIMIGAGVVAALGLVGTGVFGYRGVRTDQEVQIHVLGGLVTLLFFVLSHVWVLLYLTGAVRILRELVAEEGVVAERELFRFRRHTLPPLVAAIVLALACFLMGIGVYSGRLDAPVHAGVFYLTLAAEAWAAPREWRTLVAVERVARRARAAG